MNDETQVAAQNAEAATSTAAEAVGVVAIDAATDVAHDAERGTRHGLAHLETEFVAEWDVLKTDAIACLAWIASKL